MEKPTDLLQAPIGINDWRFHAALQDPPVVNGHSIDLADKCVWKIYWMLLGECRTVLPCGSRLAVAPVQIEEQVRGLGVGHFHYWLVRSMFVRTGVLEEFQCVQTQRGGRILGVPYFRGAFHNYTVTCGGNSSTLRVAFSFRDRHLCDAEVPFDVKPLDSERTFHSAFYARKFSEMRKLLRAGVSDARQLVDKYGPRRCRQVRRWASSRAQGDVSRLIHAVLFRGSRRKRKSDRPLKGGGTESR